MMTTKNVTLLAVLLGAAGIALAQPPQPPAFEDLDADGNGELSEAELGEMVGRFAGRGPRGAGAEGGDAENRRGPDPARILGRLDTDGSGTISKAEFEARPRMGRGRGGPPEGA